MKANRFFVAGLAIAASLCMATTAPAAFTITQQAAAAPTYSNVITFDEPGTPVGVVNKNWWADNLGMAVTIEDAVNPNAVAISDPAEAWLGTGNVAGGIFGIYQIVFTGGNATSMSFQAWDSSGAPNFFGNGLRVVLLDANNNQLANQAFTGAWGGVGNSWFNVTTTDGSSFSKVAIYNNTSFHPTYVDNVSWNVPGPGALALFGLAGVIRRGRRRS